MANDQQIRTAVIGIGALGKHHARIYSQMPGIRLIAVVDTDLEKARNLAEEYGCEALRDYRDLPADVQAVSLAVPTVDHAEIGTYLLEKGIRLLVEKPIAASLHEADRMIEAGKRSGAELLVGHSERYNPALRAVVPFIRQPRFFEGHRLGTFVSRSLDVDVILDLMIHDLDLVLWMAKERIREIRAVGIPVLTDKIDIANARIEFENGCVANLTASRVSRERVRKLRFFQPHEYVSIDFQSREVEMYALDVGNEGRPGIMERKPHIAPGEPLALEIEDFIQAIRGHHTETACTGRQGRESLAVALEIRDLVKNQVADLRF